MYPPIKLSLQGHEIRKKWEMFSFNNEQRRRKAWFHLGMRKKLFAAKLKPHKTSWMTLHMSRSLLVGSYFLATW